MKKFYFLLVCVFSTSILFAQKIPFQGRLLDNGKPYNGTATLEFSIASPSWSETKNGINVQDGYYSVVLGETTPLPDTLFSMSPEVQMNISVNGEALSPVTLYSPLLPHTGPQGIEVDTLRAFMAEAIGVNDEGKARISTTNGGYDGVMSLTDSLGRTGNFMRTRKAGGYLQLAQQDFVDNSFKSAALLGTSTDQNSFMELYGGNVTNDGISSLVLAYGSNIDLNGPIADGYRRGGIDIRNYFGNFTHNIFSEHVGTSTISHINLNASQDDSDTQYTLNLNSGDGVSTGGNIALRDAAQAQTIFLDGTTGTIDAQQILINGAPIEGSGGGTILPDSIRTKNVRVLGNAGEVKADLNFFDTNNAGSLVLNGANDSTKVILGSAGGGYGGFLGLYDSTRNIGAQLRVTNKGVGNLFTRNEAHNATGWFGGFGNDGFMQLISYDDTETVSGAALVGSFIDGALPEFYIEGTAQENFGLGRFRVTPLGNSSEETSMLEINRSNGGGQAIMTIAQDDGGADPAGSNGQVDLFGDASINIQLGSQGFDDHDLPVINMYGSIDDGGGWWYNSAQINTAKTGDGTQEFGNVLLYNNQVGSNIQTANLTGNINETGGGALELLDNTGSLRVFVDGNSGTISSNRIDGGSAANLFVSSDNGGIAIQNASDQNKLYYEASVGTLELRDDGGTTTISLDGNTGTIDAQDISIQGNPISSPNGAIISPDTINTNYITALNGSGNEGVYLRGTTEGGTIQLSSPDATNTFNRALFFGGTTTNGENAFASLYGMNPTSDGNQLLIENYTTSNSAFGTGFTGGYRRGGADYYDNEGAFLAGIGSNRDETGGDPTGKSGLVLVNGTSTRNAYLSGKWWENSNLGILQIFGQNDDGSGINGTVSVAELQALDQAGNSGAQFSMFNTNGAGSQIETIYMTTDFGSGGGFMEIRDNLGSPSVSINGELGNIDATGTITAPVLNQTSDRRLKKNIQQIKNSLSKTLQMRGVSYQWKDQTKSQRNQIGVIAQEVEAVYPEFVHTNEKGMKAVNYAQMTAVLIEAIKELNAKVVKLEEENGTLKASLSEVETLRKQMDQLMKMLGTSKAASK